MLTSAGHLDALPRLPRDEAGPVFAEPWQAQAFALAIKLSERGYFTWKQWANALALELAEAAERGNPMMAPSIINTGSQPSKSSSLPKV